MEAAAYAITIVIAYLLGSIPTGYLAGRLRGVDIRTIGSGNIGATNVFRALGTVAGVFVMLVDIAKGWIGCWLAPWVACALAKPLGGMAAGPDETWKIVAGVAAILGHNYTCWLGFKGGKGVATTAGVLVALFPKAFLIGLAVWVTVLAISRYVSLASITAAAVLPFAVKLCGGDAVLTSVAAALGLLAIWKHRGNIQRLLNGTEHRFGKKKPLASSEQTTPETKPPADAGGEAAPRSSEEP